MVSIPPIVDLPEGVRRADERLVRVTSPAATKLRELFAREGEGNLLRLAISGGGCNGLTYKMKFIQEPRRGDLLVKSGDVEVVVDSKSALYLKGTELDYSDKMVAGGFKFSNPNARSSCSCGESFSV
jgi:iron-sulfur cluster assembly protein